MCYTTISQSYFILEIYDDVEIENENVWKKENIDRRIPILLLTSTSTSSIVENKNVKALDKAIYKSIANFTRKIVCKIFNIGKFYIINNVTNTFTFFISKKNTIVK